MRWTASMSLSIEALARLRIRRLPIYLRLSGLEPNRPSGVKRIECRRILVSEKKTHSSAIELFAAPLSCMGVTRASRHRKTFKIFTT